MQQVEFFVGAQYEVHAGYAGNFLRLELGIAADDGDKGAGIDFHGALHQLAAFLIGILGNGAGIDNIHIRYIAEINFCITGIFKKPCNG